MFRLLHHLPVLAIIVAVLLSATPALAQEVHLVQDVFCQADLHQCELLLALPETGDPLTPDHVQISADGQALPLLALEQRTVPLQIAFVLDAPAIVRTNGSTYHFANAVRQLLTYFQAQGQGEQLNHDWFAAYLIGASRDDELGTIAPWQQGNYGGFINQVDATIEQLASSGPQSSAHIGALMQVIQGFADIPSVRVLIVFSDGYDRQATPAQDAELRALAQREYVTIFPIQHLLGGDAQTQQQFARLATESGGSFVPYAQWQADPATALDTIWPMLARLHRATGVAVQPYSINARQLAITFTQPTGDALQQVIPWPFPAVQPVQIEQVVINGATGDPIRIDPLQAQWKITVVITAADGLLDPSRRVADIVYKLGTQTFTQTQPALASYTINVAEVGLGKGPQVLTVHLRDRLTEAVITRQVNLLIAPPPTPAHVAMDVRFVDEYAGLQLAASLAALTSLPIATVEILVDGAIVGTHTNFTGTLLMPTTAWATGEHTVQIQFFSATKHLVAQSERATVQLPMRWQVWLQTRWYWSLLTLPVALGALWLIQTRRVRMSMTAKQGQSQHVGRGEDVTEPVEINDATALFFALVPRAKLLLIQGNAQLPHEIPLYAQSATGREEWSFGRSRQHSTCMVDDGQKRISRKHAVISAEQQRFFIHDEGSAGGTLVNNQLLKPFQPVPLQDQDLINFNIVCYQFVMAQRNDPQQANAEEVDMTHTAETEGIAL